MEIQLLVIALAVFRISNLLVFEEGPFLIFPRFRHFVGVRFDAMSEAQADNELAKLFTCIWCLSVWMGIFFAIAYYFAPNLTFWVSLPFAFSSVALIAKRITDG